MSGDQKLTDDQAEAYIKNNDDFGGDDYEEAEESDESGSTITDKTKPKVKGEATAVGDNHE